MRYTENFKFLKVEMIKRKKTEEVKEEQYFVSLNVLDDENNPCRFLIFNKDLVARISNYQFVGLQELSISFELVFTNNNWSVRLLDINNL